MTRKELEAGARAAYGMLLDEVPHSHLARAWNFIPRINKAFEYDVRNEPERVDGHDRYMAFNVGRFLSFRDVYNEPPWFPAATGVGHCGEDLILHLLYGDGSPSPVDNRRQIQPAKYSKSKFGAMPPAFDRAISVNTECGRWALVSGTASIVGEKTVHDAFDCQLEETLNNLEVVASACREGIVPADLDDWVIYLTDPRGEEAVRKAVHRRWPNRRPNLWFRIQQLCRTDLLVEIECAGLTEKLIVPQ